MNNFNLEYIFKRMIVVVIKSCFNNKSCLRMLVYTVKVWLV